MAGRPYLSESLHKTRGRRGGEVMSSFHTEGKKAKRLFQQNFTSREIFFFFFIIIIIKGAAAEKLNDTHAVVEGFQVNFLLQTFLHYVK